MHATAVDVQLGVFQRPDTSIALGNAFHTEERSCDVHPPHLA
jgi:hypothetical protein